MYGTLQRGRRYHHLLWWKRGVEFVSEGRIKGRLYDLGSFPGVVEAPDQWSYVYGELYSLESPDDTLNHIDAFEGYSPHDPDDSLFVRKLTEVFLPDGRSVKAWTYFYNAEISRASLISSGIYSGK